MVRLRGIRAVLRIVGIAITVLIGIVVDVFGLVVGMIQARSARNEAVLAQRVYHVGCGVLKPARTLDELLIFIVEHVGLRRPHPRRFGYADLCGFSRRFRTQR